MSVRDKMKVLVTIALLPTLIFLIIEGSLHNDGTQVGTGLAIIGLLGTFWGPPGGKGGESRD